MKIGNMVLAEDVQGVGNNEILVSAPNNIFAVLATPAFISLGAIIVLSGMDITKDLNLEIEFIELEEKDNKLEEVSDPVVIFKEIIPANNSLLDPHPSLSANIQLRKVRVDKLGHHKLVLKLDNERLTENIINVVKAE